MRPIILRGPRQRRLIALVTVPIAVATTLGLASMPAAAALQPSRTVISGDARFEVLSPTLIRTEYAADGAFEDRASFNAIGRDGFSATPYTQAVHDGWLTIDTGKMVVKYRVGSGAFDAHNLDVQLTTSAGQKVTGAPWTTSTTSECAPGVICEAESLSLKGLSVATDHTGYTGTGFAAGFEHVGDALTFSTDVTTAGAYDLDLRYANAQGGDGKITTRTLSIVVDGKQPQTISLPPGANWDDWKTASAHLNLSAGGHTVTVTRLSSDSGQVNLDSLAIVPAGAGYPSPSASLRDCAFGALCEAETTSLTGTSTTATDHDGFSGSGFVAGLWTQGASLTAHVTGVPAAGTYALQVRYANGRSTSPTLTAQPAGGPSSTGKLPPTSGWDYWRTVAVPVQLAAGDSDVTVGCPTESAGCNVNIDTFAVTDAEGPLLAPHAALGGYRRDLDTANGPAKTNPGLLYQDGWSVLDDTQSSIYDPSSQKVQPRPDHPGSGTTYRDGYVFGYGSDYTAGLRDLAVLTGPTKLLPRWAYGVWYSEYYDRTQSEFAAIADEFKTKGVPVDVMAIDTDYKSPSKWNGWEIDTTRFPDMSALLSDWHAKGIHNTLNIHPTISSDDPQFAAAQATAKGALTSNGGRYVFDWSDPNQLAAYFDLHDQIGKAGVDIWWLDWCCSENSTYTDNGVTPDAFINNAYADYTDSALGGRGFAFSRAYGSLTAGGYGHPQAVPTGPWADKRTTIHFTGDTTSSWAMLAAQVGYTPGESASTGLAAISHDIGGHNGSQYGIAGAEPGSTQLPADLYARWVQFGAFQPIDRLHSNHNDRMPWQYPAAADASATKFLNLRENLVPLTYSLAQQANATGTPIVRPLYLQYPDSQEAYAMAGSEYLYGPDVLVAPVITGGTTASTSVWFPEGSDWTDYFTGKTYRGGTTATVTTDLDSMPVFIRSGGIVPTRTENVTNDSSSTSNDLTVTVAGGADGSFALYEDSGENSTKSGKAASSMTTPIDYTSQPHGGTVEISGAHGRFAGQTGKRQWTVVFSNADRPASVTIDGEAAADSAWTYDAAHRTLSVVVSSRPAAEPTVVGYSTGG